MRSFFVRAALLIAVVAAGAPARSDAQAAKKTETLTLDWNQFRGPKRNAHSADTGLLKQWPTGGPALAWKATGIGAGFSSVCASGKFVFTMGEDGNKIHLVALSVADGKILWKLPVGNGFTEQQGGTGPRSTPATDGAVVISVSPTGEITCAAAATGRVAWQKRMQEFGASQPGFGFVESPYIDGNLVLLSPGGTVLALNKANGQTVWKSRKLKGSTDYSSLSVGEIGRAKQYLVMTDKSVAGILATSGAILWEGDFPGDRAVVPTPVAGNGIVFVAAGYGVGCKAFNVALGGAEVKFQEAYASTQFQIHHGGMVLVGEHVYGLHDQGSLRCIELATGKPVWTDRCVGKGSIAYADGKLYCRGEGGAVALVEASPTAYKELGRFTPALTTGNKCWAHPAVSGGKLYLREQDTLFAHNVKE
ncbi:MAG TPA: PQQ-binding-like beta-propeller repeat protein [Planctomycetota bacterium]|nr:PQQ-binding-like beta-propeller repeat protein [Planctomycetota bacterium]